MPVADAGNDVTINFGETTVLSGSGGVIYSWSPSTDLDDASAQSPISSTGSTITYTLTVTDANGCESEDSVTVVVLDLLNVAIPNAFSPNGDGKNDVFRPVLISGAELIDFSVFNRWGERVFWSDDINVGWDGTVQGKATEMDTYLFIARFLERNKTKVLNGSLTLVR